MKRKEIKWRREGRRVMTGRQDGVIFQIWAPYDAPEKGYSVSSNDTKGKGRSINTAGHKAFPTWEEAVEFCQQIVVGEVDLKTMREEFDAQDAAKERQAIRKAQEQAEAERREASRRRNERRRRIVRRRRITALACMAALVLAVVWAVAMACAAVGADEPETILPDPVAVTPITTPAAVLGEDPMEAEKIEAALLEQGYFSEEIPLSYDLQDVMRTACAEYGCPYPLALAVAEVESHFDMDAVGAVGEVGIMQLNPGPQNTYWINLEAETGEDPTTPAGNIICGAYLLGTHMANYGEPEKALMAYNMGPGGAAQAWAAGITSTEYSAKVMEAMDRWEAVLA